MNSLIDTIVGISTQQANGAISIIRLSGDNAIEIVNKIFKGKDLTKQNTHTIHYGFIVENDNVIDEVLVSLFKAPKTYTRQDVVEINCHGGIFVTNRIYELCVLSGARPAEPGEFTKRAFLSGRIDLSQAEAVMDMIEAENNSTIDMASKGLRGFIKEKVNNLRERLLNIVANIAVNIDYPEYDDVEEVTNKKIKNDINEIKIEIGKILEQSKSAKYIKNGINIAIIGKPNVGKSSLLNALIEEEKAIVTDIPGTTRDIVDAKINIGNITCNFIDTAGIRKTNDTVEKIGVERSLQALEKADFILFVVDGSKQLDAEDQMLYNNIKDKKHIVIINKKDLGTVVDIDDDNKQIVSTKDLQDIEFMKKLIQNFAEENNLNNKDITYISNARQIEKFNLAYQELIEALKEIEENAFIDFIDIHLKAAWSYLGEITGEVASDALLDELFSKFCLGK